MQRLTSFTTRKSWDKEIIDHPIKITRGILWHGNLITFCPLFIESGSVKSPKHGLSRLLSRKETNPIDHAGNEASEIWITREGWAQRRNFPWPIFYSFPSFQGEPREGKKQGAKEEEERFFFFFSSWASQSSLAAEWFPGEGLSSWKEFQLPVVRYLVIRSKGFLPTQVLVVICYLLSIAFFHDMQVGGHWVIILPI